ncbi:MAG TPA: outer membrane lipoprotein-sorting protein [Candidatus Eisenbacteria bacterium]|nr:outer membrane lipoprotein-sorting protein [Candidatus Eisenbacteria bacterium]
MKFFHRAVLASFDRPWTVVLACVVITLLAVVASLRIRIDTDPENMLAATQPDRVVYDRMKKEFGLHDLIVVGIVDPRGAFRPETLAATAVAIDSILDLPGVIPEDVVSLTTTDNPQSEADLVDIHPVMSRVPTTAAEAESLRLTIAGNPYLNEVIASPTGDALAIYVPIVAKDQSVPVAKAIRRILDGHLPAGVRYHMAGLPIAEDTFGHEMFIQMAVVAPLAFIVILLLVFFLFGELSFLLPVGVVAALSVIWTMGLLIAMGFTVHIMSSMIPIFLMPIAILDAVHILSEFQLQRRIHGVRRTAIDEAMRSLFTPVAFTSVTAAVGFGSLGFANIPPVRVFGAFVAVGIVIAYILTHTLLPALVALLPLKPARPAAEGSTSSFAPALRWIGSFAYRRARLVLTVAFVFFAVGAVGISKLRSDDNPVRWFRPGHPMREAHDALNARFGGTYMAHVIVDAGANGAAQSADVVAWMNRFQRHLEGDSAVGKTSSVADIVRRLNRVVHGGNVAYDRIPAASDEVGQLIFLFQGSGDPDDIDNYLDHDARRANIWVQMRDGDNHAMTRVEARAAAFVKRDPPPGGGGIVWSGLNHINLVWQHLMVNGMMKSIFGSFAVICLLMIIEFRSWPIGILCMVPLSVEIVASYGAIGLVSGRYDMPIAVCSSLALGLSVDFAIHFFERVRHRWDETRDMAASVAYVFGAPGLAIVRNAIVISLGFLPLVVSTLTPYVTVGLLFAGLMIAGALATLFLLPAILRLLGDRVFATTFALLMIAGIAGIGLHAAPASAAAAVPALPNGRALMDRCVKAWYYAGDDAVAKIRMEIVGRGGEKRYRVMTLFRKNVGQAGGDQRYLLYFHEPGDVRRMTCMVSKHAGADDERWMYVPAANNIRRVAAPERSRFLGSDFTREEFAGRDAAADSHMVARYERLDGHPCWVVESTPKKPVEYTRMTTWVDTTTFIPWKQEFRDRRDAVYRTYTTDSLKTVVSAKGKKYLTITERTMWGRGKGTYTKLYFESVVYDVGLADADFSNAHLRVPLDEWYRGTMP